MNKILNRIFNNQIYYNTMSVDNHSIKNREYQEDIDILKENLKKLTKYERICSSCNKSFWR